MRPERVFAGRSTFWSQFHLMFCWVRVEQSPACPHWRRSGRSVR
ncbi:hypothetical protein E9229_003467 [Paeniglutamicibacter cryotolerans]|uniref:Uncharacterized protein n=1 Tax=Paeniglutamicibacter cryotolerans TaxID=670079 RepID=A0A839QN73_9MICC|nr:hypothetical protein [Paeniglutamicibacter cryotolerans]